MKILRLEVNKAFYKKSYFSVDPFELRLFLESLVGWIEDNGEVILPKDIDIERTIRHHSGDCRIWSTDSGYYDFFPEFVLISVTDAEWYETVYDWLEEKIPTLYKKHIEYEI